MARIETGKVAKLEGMKELQLKLRDLLSTVEGADARKEVQKVIGEVAQDLRREVAARIMAIPDPAETTDRSGRKIGRQQILESLFTYNKQPEGERRRARFSALVGIRKRGRTPYASGYVEWRAGRHPKSPRAKVAPGGLIGESLATMIEMGTTKRVATPFFRPAITTSRSRIVPVIATGYRAILQRFGKL